MNNIQQQEKLVNQGQATKSVNGDYVTYKYHRNVMFAGSWTPELIECRGHTYDLRNGHPITVPFPKFFAYAERGTGASLSDDTQVKLYRKVNGFMVAATLYRGEPFVSTTGSTRSEFAGWARELLKTQHLESTLVEGQTNLYEACVPQDPHIVQEVYGLHPIAVRNNTTGHLTLLNSVMEVPLGKVLDMLMDCRHEGYMVQAGSTIFKLKSPYYVGLKSLMRKRQVPGDVPAMWNIAATQARNTENWVHIDEQERRKMLEGWFNGK